MLLAPEKPPNPPFPPAPPFPPVPPKKPFPSTSISPPFKVKVFCTKKQTTPPVAPSHAEQVISPPAAIVKLEYCRTVIICELVEKAEFGIDPADKVTTLPAIPVT